MPPVGDLALPFVARVAAKEGILAKPDGLLAAKPGSKHGWTISRRFYVVFCDVVTPLP